MKTSYPFWRVTLSNVPSSVSTDHIKSEFAKYGDVHTVKYGASSSSMEVTFKSPKKPNSIDSIVNGEPKYKVTAGTDSPSSSSSSSLIKLPTTKKIKSPTTKISLLKSPPVSKSSKYNTMKFNMGMDTKTIAKNSKLSSSAAPFTSPLTSRVHITNTSKSKASTTSNTSTSSSHGPSSDDNEGVFFEAVCKSITHETTEEEILDFIKENIFPSIKNEVVKDGVMMLAGESMAVFELNNRDAIDKLTKIINSNQADSNLQFNGNKFTLQRKTNENDVPPPNVKGLSITLEDDDDETASQRVINSNGINVNVVNDKNGSDYLAACYLDYNLNQNGNHDDDKKEDVIKRDPHPNKVYQFDLTEEAKTLLTKQAQTLKIPKSSFVLMLGVLTTNGPVTIPMIHNWKRSGLTTGNLSQFLPVTNIQKSDSNKKQDITSNVDVRTNSSPALSSNRSNNGTEPVHLEKKRSFNSNQGSPIGSIGSTPAAALFADAASGSSKRSSPLSSDAQNKKNKKIVASGSKTTNLSTLTKAPLVKTGSFKKESAASNPTQTAGKRMFQYPSNQALNTSSLFANNSSSNLLTNPTVGVSLGPNSLISPRAATSGVSLIKMKSGGNATLLSPTAAATLISPRRNTGNPAPVMVPNQQNMNQFTMNNPIGNVTPIHIPGFGQNNNIGNNGQSPINTGFQSPLNYNINTPQSPLSNFITPVLQNTFTPTTNGLNAITPTAANLGFYWNNVHNKGNNNGNTMGNMNMENDPLAPTNMTAPGPFPFTQQSSNPYVQQQLQKTSLLPQISANTGSNNGGNNVGNNGGNNVGNDKSSPLSKPASTFFKYPIPAEEPKSSPSNSNNMLNNTMSNGVNNMLNGISSLPSLQQQQSSGSTAFDANQMNMNMMNGMNTNNNLLMMNNGGNNNQMMQMNRMNMNNMNNMGNNNNMNMGNNNMMNNMNDDDDMNDDEQQMDQPPSLDEINNMRSIPSVISPNGTTPVVMITNLNEDQIDCDKIFTLCGVFGDVQRVKISYHKRDTAFVQLSNHRQAKHVVTSLNRMQLYGKMIHVNLSRMTRVKLPKDSPNSAMMFPDAKFLTKDYTNCKKHRYSKKGAGGIKYSPLSIGQPSHILHIANLPIQTEAKDLQEFLCGNGIFAKNEQQNAPVSASRGFNPDDKINAIELIGVNNKLGSCQAFAKCVSVDIACQILIDYHSKEFLGREIKISFATRSHMPSDINKTHKTYSYTAPKQRAGTSINSIPTSIPRQNSNSQPPLDSRNSSNNNVVGGDNMSSSSSNNSSHSGMNPNNSSSNTHSNGGYYNNHMHRNNMDYNSRHNAVCSSFPKNVISNRDSYMDGYNNSVGYQTYVVNKPAPPDQDKIFVRQHHHSGGRKYHYKLRINK